MEPILRDEQIRATIEAARCGQENRPANYRGTIVPDALGFALMVRALWPVKTVAALMDLCGIPERTARAYARGDREPPMSVLWLLLRSREGARVEAFIMDHEPPDWWLEDERHRRMGAAADKEGAGNE